MTPSSTASDHATGLRSDRLNPAQITAMLQGLARRGHDRLTSFDPDDTAGIARADAEFGRLADRIAVMIRTTKEAGYALDREVRDHTPSDLSEDDGALVLLATGALELARWIAGVPATAWNDHLDLLEQLRELVVELSVGIRTIGTRSD